ncbi:MAG TPA: septum formation inhibitor Maf [Clostridiales bacterium]|nr:septum formation inhibitor Maf [Clostridiales bacterium]
MVETLNNKKLILASASPRRKELLDQVGIKYEVLPSNFEEHIEDMEGTPAEKAEKLAYLKARDVASKLKDCLVLGADTIVVVDNEVLGKPKDLDDAKSMLSRLSGKEHQVITGVALIDTNKNIELVSHETTSVKFRKLTSRMINSYLAAQEPMGKAGAYAIQGFGALLIEGINGCYSNVVGLPLTKLSKMIESLNTQS